MKIVFLGVGEAFDEELPNNSHLILSNTILFNTKILLDCGYSIPRELWKFNPDQSFLSAIYVSHAHADHYFGIPAVLTRMWEEKRKKPLTIICQKKLKLSINELLEYGYRKIAEKFEFKLDFLEAKEDRIINFNEFKLEFAPTIHSVSNLAIKINYKKINVCYSGDGMFTEETEKLYKGSNLLIHEAFTLDEKLPNHANITDLIGMAKRNKIKCLALTHIRRDVRKNQMDLIKERIAKEKLKIIIPKVFEDRNF